MLFALFTAVLASSFASADPIDTFANVTIYDPGTASADLNYARTLSLTNNTVLATWSDLNSANGTIPIYKSTNNGFSWFTFGTATSDDTSKQLLQPHLIYVNETFGDYDAGSILLAVNAVNSTSTSIQIYASGDSGESWDFVSTVATGGPANTTTGVTPLGEPFLVYQ